MNLLKAVDTLDIDEIEDMLPSISTHSLNKFYYDSFEKPYTVLDRAFDISENGPSDERFIAKIVIKLLIERGALKSTDIMNSEKLFIRIPKSRRHKYISPPLHSHTTSKPIKNGLPPIHPRTKSKTMKNGIAISQKRRNVKL